ncbi:hypothetical protein BD414DRAFT_476965 [Trametes punicea]|nr:hypothetical protein BD414DRAFT_476965 [Trametes punicea]
MGSRLRHRPLPDCPVRTPDAPVGPRQLRGPYAPVFAPVPRSTPPFPLLNKSPASLSRRAFARPP